MKITKPAQFPSPMLLFGCGNMAGAMVDGWMAAGIGAEHFHIVEPYAQNLPEGAAHFTSAAQADQKYDTLLIGIKPQMLAELAGDIRKLLAPNALVISILSGVGTEALARHFPDARILRLMPNLAAALGKAPLGLFSADLNDAEKSAVQNFLAPLGTAYWMDGEDDMHAFTAIAGCGPAFLYRFIDALAQAGEQLGIDPARAGTLAKEMIYGASQLAALSPHTAGDLAAKVASAGGSTAAGLIVMDDHDAILRLMENTLKASRDRSVEQGKEAE
jgi:pyrroline-5-carboxylate reductase